MEKVIGVIPARWASVRFKGKVLAPLLGKPVLQHVWERARESKLLDDLIIACDDDRVCQAAKDFGAKVVLTSKDHKSGSDRIAEVVESLDVQIVVNIQGDEPLIHFSMIDGLARALCDDEPTQMATLIKKIDNEKDLQNPNIVKVVIDQQRFALYFSRASIPFNREELSLEEVGYYKHLGLYAYKKDFLFVFKQLRNSQLEQIEKLEQLRVLEAGYRIKTFETTGETVGIDTKEDIKKVERFLKKKE